MFHIRPMMSADIDAVLAVESEYYAGPYVEPADVITARLRNFPDTAWVAEDAGGVCAYLSCFRSRLGTVIALGSDFPLVDNPDTFYLHDMAVSRRAAGRGIGKALAQQALSAARQQGLACSSLVSLPDAVSFWQSFGYAEAPLADPAQRAILAGYLSDVRHMVLRL